MIGLRQMSLDSLPLLIQQTTRGVCSSSLTVVSSPTRYDTRIASVTTKLVVTTSSERVATPSNDLNENKRIRSFVRLPPPAPSLPPRLSLRPARQHPGPATMGLLSRKKPAAAPPSISLPINLIASINAPTLPLQYSKPSPVAPSSEYAGGRQAEQAAAHYQPGAGALPSPPGSPIQTRACESFIGACAGWDGGPASGS